ncbi:MAG TPA: pectinesterase family protein [Edaphobacter sp.]|nr:pectinesterase family protein [Edaphobacter sp.]
MSCGIAWAQGPKTITVGGTGADFTTIQAGVNAAPDEGAVIRIRPGVYREVVHVDKAKIQLRGDGDDWKKVVLVYGNSAASTCGTSCSATLFVTSNDFFAGNMTIANDYSKTNEVPSQAVAVSVRADRAVLRHVRLLGAQDTLYASSMGCMKEGGECVTGRQYYSDCYIEGHVDFIFGDAKAVFENCEVHSIPHGPGGYLTAQSNTRPDQDAGYVFNHCKITADAGAGDVYLGRPWRDFSTVIFMNTDIEAPIVAAGWSDWKSAPQPRLPTATYAEFNSTGAGANAKAREPYSKQLTAQEAKKYEAKAYLAGADGWDPTAMK